MSLLWIDHHKEYGEYEKLWESTTGLNKPRYLHRNTFSEIPNYHYRQPQKISWYHFLSTSRTPSLHWLLEFLSCITAVMWFDFQLWHEWEWLCVNVFTKCLSVVTPSNLFCPEHHKDLEALAESYVCVMSLSHCTSRCMTLLPLNTIFLTRICQVISQEHTLKHVLCSCKSWCSKLLVLW